MNIEFFIHGVPKGEDFWGAKEDQAYFNNFYDNSKDEVKFLIQVRTIGSKIYCYYNYLVYKDVTDNEGRAGAYFGISLRLDAYCKDFVNMYRILDTTYNVFCMGTLVRLEGNKTKYTIAKFASVANLIDDITKSVFRMVKSAFTNNSFIPVDKSFSINGVNLLSCNLYDCTQENVLAAVKQYGKIAISPYYRSANEVIIQQQCNAQIQALQQQCSTRLKTDAEVWTKEKNEVNSILVSTKDNLRQVQGDLAQKDHIIQQLNAKISGLERKLELFTKCGKVTEIVSQIKKPIDQLASLLNQIFPRPIDERDYTIDSKHGKRTPFIIGTIKCIFPFINFVLLLFLVFASFSLKIGQVNKSDSESKEESAVHNSTDDEISQRDESDSFTSGEIQINIEGLEGDHLIRGRMYKVTVQNDVLDGTWEVRGCEKTDTDNPKVINIRPTENAVEIIYSVNGGRVGKKTLTAE